MPTEKSIALPPTTKVHQEPHRPQRGMVVHPDIAPGEISITIRETSEHGVFNVTYWHPVPLDCDTQGRIYDLERALATWEKVKVPYSSPF
jgi:hypothetical protein